MGARELRGLGIQTLVPKVNADYKIRVITPGPLLIAGFISEFYAQEEVIVHSVAAVRNIAK